MTFSTGLIIDIAIVVIFLLYILIDSIRGFFKAITSLVVIAVSLIVAINFTAPFADFINEKFVSAPVTEKVSETVNEIFFGEDADGEKKEEDISSRLDGSDEQINGLLSKFGIDTDEFFKELGSKAKNTADDLATELGVRVSSTISRVVAFAILFLGSAVITWIIMKFFDHLFRGKTLKKLNGFFGGVVGGIKGIIVVFILCRLLCKLLPLLGGVEGIPDDILDSTHIVRFIGHL